MNYALDAIWWRLKNPYVRDLASILTAPPLWQTGCELSVRELLGETGFRQLLAWDDANFRLPERGKFSRLGHYAEALLAFWLEHAAHSELVAREYCVENGALDFIARLNGIMYHIELTCKYFGDECGQPEKMRGLNPSDTLIKKQQKLSEQLARPLNHLNPNEICRASVVRGMGFTFSGSLNNTDTYPQNAWCGVLWHENLTFDETARFCRLGRLDYLSPARVAFEETLGAADIHFQEANELIAQVALRPDGFWHEIQRIMVRNE